MKTVDWGKLSEPFGPEEVRWRILQSGKSAEGRIWARVVSYVDRASIEDRLDQAAGPEGWKCSYERQGDAIVCTLAIRTEEGWIEKSDAAGLREQEEDGQDAVKTAYTEAFKRAAVKWGIARELYKREEAWAVVHLDGKGAYRAKLKDGTVFSWDPPVPGEREKEKRPEAPVERVATRSPHTDSREREQRVEALLARSIGVRAVGKPRNGNGHSNRFSSVALAEKDSENGPMGRRVPLEPTEDSDERVEEVQDQIIEMLSKPPFTKEDLANALKVFPKIHTLYGLQCYKKQWEEELLKRTRKSK